MPPLRFSSLLFLALTCFGAGRVVAEEVRISGSSTVFITLVKDTQKAVATETGISVNAMGSTSGRGLQALQGGFVQIAMLTGHLPDVVAGLADEGIQIQAEDLVEHFVREERLVVVVHPSNPVSTLSETQVRQILTGQIRHWRDLGGPVAPISVFFERPDTGNSIIIEDHLLKGAKVRAPSLRFVDNSRLIVHNVRRVSTGFGLSSSALLTPDVKVVEGYSLPQPLCLVTRKDASPETLKVLEAFLAHAKASKTAKSSRVAHTSPAAGPSAP